MPTAGVAPYDKISIVNKSTVMSDADGTTIVNALNVALPIFCSDWKIPVVTAVYVAKGKTALTPLQCLIFDDSDIAGALGYHSQSNDLPYGKVFVKTILKYGGTMLLGPASSPNQMTVASVIAHEVFEMVGDLRANVWWMLGDYNTLYAAEVSDPVEGNISRFTTKNASNATVTVGLADWVLPSWADPQSKSGPYNHNNTLTSPFQLDKGGYVVKLVNGTVSYVFGSAIPEWKKTDLCGRGVKRSDLVKSKNK